MSATAASKAPPRCKLPPLLQSGMLAPVMKSIAAVCAGACLLVSAANVHAGEPESPPTTISIDAEPQPAEARGDIAQPTSDHERHIGRFLLAFHGTRVIPAVATGGSSVSIDGTGSATLTIAPDEAIVPLFGIRYWATNTVGLDIGVGAGFETGSFTRMIPNPDPALDRTSEGASARRTNIAGRLAAPISVRSGKHYNLMFIPEFSFGYSRTLLPAFHESTTGQALDLRVSGFVLSAGAQLGHELSFGFLGAPQVSLQTAWGLRVESRKRSGKIGDAEATLSDLGIGTSFHGEPWQWLTGSISLFYAL